MDGYFAGLGAEHVAADAYEVTDVEKFLEYGIIEFLVFSGAYLVARYIHLDAAESVLKLHKRGFAHDTSAHDTAGDRYFADGRVVGEVGLYFIAVSCNGKFCCRIWLYAEASELGQTIASDCFLFAEFEWIHM